MNIEQQQTDIATSFVSRRWSSVNAIYQIYPRSFQDTTSNGVGDLAGIVSRLDYLADKNSGLGVDAIWLSPFFTSPMKDFGYDVADYCNVDPLFGTLTDFDILLSEAHARGLKVMIDYVPNHTSDHHPWFLESASATHNPKADWYTWVDPKPDGSAPNNWLSVFGGSAWTWNESRRQYYLHTFLTEQPDLNWDNPDVRRAMMDVLRFWMDRGVDGIRADAVRWISKDPLMRDAPMNPNYDPVTWTDPYSQLTPIYSQDYDHLFDRLNEMNDVIAGYDDRIIVFEHYPLGDYQHAEQYAEFYQKIKRDVGGPFNLDGIALPLEAEKIQQFVDEYQTKVGQFHTMFYCFSNHDQSRLVARYGDDGARIFAVLLMTLPGIPTMYYGDELGMDNGTILPEQVQDPFEKRVGNVGLGRDPQRTPMQWSDVSGAGFTKSGVSWLPINDDYKLKNVTIQKDDTHSFLNLYSQLLKLRTDYPILRHARSDLKIRGEFKINQPGIVQYEVSDEQTTLIVYINLSEHSIPIQLSQLSTSKKPSVIVSTNSHHYDDKRELGSMQAWVIEFTDDTSK